VRLARWQTLIMMPASHQLALGDKLPEVQYIAHLSEVLIMKAWAKEARSLGEL
jgi:hypothetical protein